QRGEVGEEAIGLDLEQRPRRRKPSEAMRAERPERDAVRNRAPDSHLRLSRRQDLAAVSYQADPRRRVHREADVTRVGQGGLAAVEPRPDATLEILRPLRFTHRQ